MRPRSEGGRLLKPSEVEVVLRRAAQLGSLRPGRLARGESGVLSDSVMQAAMLAGIPPEDVRQAVVELFGRKAADPPSYMRTLLGPARIRTVREIGHPAEPTEEYLEELLHRDAELKLRHRADGVSVWDPGSSGGMMRRTLDLSSDRPLLKTRSVEMIVAEDGEDRCIVDFIADLSNQRAEQASLAVLIGVTLAVMFLLAGIQNPAFLLGVIPALLLPSGGFRLAFMKSKHDTMRVLDALQDAAEAGQPKESRGQAHGPRNPGEIQNLEPIPRFSTKDSDTPEPDADGPDIPPTEPPERR